MWDQIAMQFDVWGNKASNVQGDIAQEWKMSVLFAKDCY